jgi:integrase
MSEKRIVVWVQHFADRPFLMLQWHDEHGKRKSRSAETCNPLEAEKKRADLEYELNHGLYQEASSMSWEKFRQLFEAEYVSGRRKNTRQNYQATLDLFEQLCKPGRLKSINERTVSGFAAAMRTMPVRGRVGMMPSTIKVRLQFLHTAFMWAVDQGLLPKCPKFPEAKVPKKKPRPVPAETFERLLLAKTTDAHMRAFLLCGWLAGLRLSEALALEWEPSQKVPWVEFGGDRIWLPAEFSKATEDQWVALDPQLRAALEQLPRRDGDTRVFRFISRRTGEPITQSGMSDRIERLAKSVGVKLNYHTLRKGFGCRYAGKVPAQVLQKLMRHASIRTTMDYYANVDEAAMTAILGPRNSSRNSEPSVSNTASAPVDVTQCQDGLSIRT